ncbi:ATP-binding protein [Undibacterium sp. SXout7W]|uniref:ATP-binding protein n=1 Tax=Undibacterium sp. SXout7W TaxID=3413049 RepID=UPI003BF3F959
MMPHAVNAATLERELAWCAELIDAAIKLYFGQECTYADVCDIAAPSLEGDSSAYASLIQHHQMNANERLVLILALAPHLRPQLLDPFLMKNILYDRGFTEFGGIVGTAHAGFFPTVESAAFILAGANLERRLVLASLFDPEHFFRRQRMLDIEPHRESSNGADSIFSTPLTIHREQLTRITTGEASHPGFSNHFPAQRLQTSLAWEDLILPRTTMHDVEEIRAWIVHGETLMHEWKLKKYIKPGFRSLFYGPPGTGKTLTASLLGNVCQLPVYRIDLSLIVSKYIGETEKNLGSVFDQAANKNWILFFDEADALFGKRTQTSSSNDRYANQEVAYLLQRIEDFPGVVLLATNLKSNIDDAFARRFQSMIYFPMPSAEERLRLWRNAFTEQVRLDVNIDLEQIADQFEISGGAILNVLRYACLMALRRGSDSISQAELLQGIHREMHKEGRIA